MVASNEHVPGNLEVIGTLDAALKEAKKGVVGYVALVMADGKQYSIGVSGNINLEPIIIEGLNKAVTEVITPARENRETPKQDESLDKSYVVYNLANGPASFDFIAWLVDREMERIEANAPSPLKVAIYLGKDGKVGLNSPLRQQMYNGVLKPAVELVGGVLDDKALYGHRKELYTVRGIQEKVKSGQKVVYLHAPERAQETAKSILKDITKPVTITLREYVEWPHRNSHIDEWVKFADYLSEKGYTPLFIRDTLTAHEMPVSKYKELPQASYNLAVRTAVYEQSFTNMFVSNGPSALALFTPVPWLMFHTTEADGSLYAPATPEFVKQFMGIDITKNEQQAWCTPKQQLVQKTDTFEHIKEAWERIIEND